jgi:ribosomal protein S18 acetylase RimI-like enzyme
MISTEQLVLKFFRVPLERSAYQFTRHDSQGCMGHVGMDLRSVRFRIQTRPPDSNGEVVVRTLEVPVGAIRFVLVRADCRMKHVARTLMDLAEEAAFQENLPYLLAFTDGPFGFYRKIGFYPAGNGAWVLNVKALESWPEGFWEPIGEKW